MSTNQTASHSVSEEGALAIKKLTFWEAALIVVGANIGSGILGLAYSARKAGWPSCCSGSS